jgi:hypothetical protein
VIYAVHYLSPSGTAPPALRPGGAGGPLLPQPATPASRAARRALGSIFASLIDVFADFAEKKSKLLIALGIADLAIPGLQATGAAELAGGIGLLAAAGLARAGAAAITASTGGGSSGAGSGLSTSIPSAPRAYTPNTPAAPTSTIITHKVIMTANGATLAGVLEISEKQRGRVTGKRV